MVGCAHIGTTDHRARPPTTLADSGRNPKPTNLLHLGHALRTPTGLQRAVTRLGDSLRCDRQAWPHNMLRVTRGKLTLTPERRIGPSTQAAQLRPSVDRASAMAHRNGHTPPPIRSACAVLPLASLTSLHTLGPKAPTARSARQTREFAPPQADLMSPERTAAQSSRRTRTSASSRVATVHRRKLSGCGSATSAPLPRFSCSASNRRGAKLPARG